tara:strand:- start:662 stop:1033 length:372 start_codon:yes stop_codon:yes gene_type:complete
MKAFKDFMEALTLQQRKKRSIIAKKKAKITAIKRKRSMKKPPTPDKIDKAVNKAVRQKAITLVDKAGKYKDPDASIGLKTNIEKKADLKVQKMGNKWKKRLKPIIKKKMKDAFKQRQASAQAK